MSARSRTKAGGALFNVIRTIIIVVVLVVLFYVGWLLATEIQGFIPDSKAVSIASTSPQTNETAATNAVNASTVTVSTTPATPAGVLPPAPENPYASAYNSGSEVVIDGNTLDVALSTTTKAIDQGLQSQPSLSPNDGMLFIFNAAKIYQFWMPNMNFSLDMIWIGSDNKIVSISKDAPPLPDPTKPVWFRPTSPAQYVLEVNAGYADEHTIKIGDTVQFVSIPQ
jgi:uncharacterized membrane protein (UPF0127 family)